MKPEKASAFSVIRDYVKSYNIENARSPSHESSKILSVQALLKPKKKRKRKNKKANLIKKKIGTSVSPDLLSVIKSKKKKHKNSNENLPAINESNSNVKNLKSSRKAAPQESKMRELRLQTRSSAPLSSEQHRRGIVSPIALTTPKLKKNTLVHTHEICTMKNSPKRTRRRTFDDEMELSPSLRKDDDLDDKKKIIPMLPYMFDSSVESQKLFQWLISPVEPQRFFRNLWERKPLLVKRHHSKYYNGIFSCKELDRILREEHVQYAKHIDVTSYQNGERQTHNLVGRAYASTVWDFFQSGCTLRLLNPQTYSKEVWKLNSILQDYFGSYVGANVYLTPAGSQGFAPHYDDIEAFVLQLEGKKHWRLYNPRSESEMLPRYSSQNFKQDEVGSPILEIELEAGDLLYFPRGTIHQADSPENCHSLHITISTYQKNTWGDLLEALIPQALNLAIKEDLDFRKALPRDFFSYMGIANCDVENAQRTAFLRKIQQLLSKLLNFAPVDAAVDQMGKQYIISSLPPYLTDGDRSCSIHGNGEFWENGNVVNTVELEPDTKIKLIRKDICRLVMEEDKVMVYYSMENSRIYLENEPQFIEITPEKAPAVEFLMHSYPEYVTVENLPLDTLQEKIEVSTVLYEKGLIVTSEPLEPLLE